MQPVESYPFTAGGKAQPRLDCSVPAMIEPHKNILAGWTNSGYTAPALKAYFTGAHE